MHDPGLDAKVSEGRKICLDENFECLLPIRLRERMVREATIVVMVETSTQVSVTLPELPSASNFALAHFDSSARPVSASIMHGKAAMPVVFIKTKTHENACPAGI